MSGDLDTELGFSPGFSGEVGNFFLITVIPSCVSDVQLGQLAVAVACADFA